MVREQRAKYPRSTFISHPRSGLTWFRWMLHEVRKRHDPENLKKPPGDTEEWNPLIAYDHDGIGLTSTPGRLARHPRMHGENKWKDYKVVFLIRDPRDTILSNYYRLVVRGKQVLKQKKRVEHFGLKSFFQDGTLGLKPLVEWIVWWDKHRTELVDFMPVFYEETLMNPASALSCILEMATDENVSIDTCLEVADASTFEIMKRHEAEHGTIYKDQAGAVNDDPDTALIRNGTAEQWKGALNNRLRLWCLSTMAPLRGTFAERYLDV